MVFACTTINVYSISHIIYTCTYGILFLREKQTKGDFHMKINKILLTLALGTGLIATACGPKNTGTKVTLWVSEVEGVKELTTKLIRDFEAAEGVKIAETIETVSEAEAATKMLTDVDQGADIYSFAQDQFARLVQGGALAKLGAGAAATVKADNDAGSVAAVTSGSDLYAYPMTSDNGYFMYYDKSVINEEHLNSLEDLIADCEAAGRKFSFEMQTSAWYLASFFFGTGCHSEWTVNNKGKFIAYDDDFNSEKGLIAVKGMKKLVDSTAHVSSSSVDDFVAATPSAIVVSGTWAYNDALKNLGENLGAAKLPSFTVDGETYQLGSYSGYKLIGVKPHEDVQMASLCNKLALWLTNASAQEQRFDAVAWGPSNKSVQAMEKVAANPALAALAAQSPFSTPQGQIHGSWWDLAKVIGTDVKDAADEAGLQAALQKYADGLEELIALDTDAWLLVGAWNGWNNADKAPTYYAQETEDEDIFKLTLVVPESDYMGGRFVHPGSWDSDMGCLIVTEGADLLKLVGDETNPDNNIVFVEPGTYDITLDVATPAISIVKLLA